MATNPRWQRGADLYACRITPLAADALGALAVGAGGEIVELLPKSSTNAGVLDDITYNARSVTEDIAPLTSPSENNVEVERDDSVLLTEIMRPYIGQNLLAAAMVNALVGAAPAEYLKLEIFRGQDHASAGTNKVTKLEMYTSMMEYRETVRKGKSTCQMTLGLMEAGASLSPNPTYSHVLVSTV